MATYLIRNHQHKGRFLMKAFRHANWRPSTARPDLIFYDKDAPIYGEPYERLMRHKERGAKIVLYQHAAMPPWWYDGFREVNDYVDLYLSFAPATTQFMNTYVPLLKTIEIGWAWCNQKPFEPIKKPRKICFAPIHPSAEGLNQTKKDTNARVFEAILQLPESWYKEIRIIGSLEANGLWHDRRVSFSQARPDGKTHNIDRADVVIGEGTFVYLSVARGRPTISLLTDKPPCTNRNENHNPEHWEDWKHLVRYPYDFDDAPLEELIEQATAKEATEWRKLNIGQQLRYNRLISLLEKELL
jgi:hypothetical protein